MAKITSPNHVTQCTEYLRKLDREIQMNEHRDVFFEIKEGNIEIDIKKIKNFEETLQMLSEGIKEENPSLAEVLKDLSINIYSFQSVGIADDKEMLRIKADHFYDKLHAVCLALTSTSI